MGVNVEVCGVEVDEREYPFLGQCGDAVMLFYAHGCGTVICDPDEDMAFDLGYHSTEWDMDMFEPFGGTVKLSNDDTMVMLDEALD
jgi:hypothetical protein